MDKKKVVIISALSLVAVAASAGALAFLGGVSNLKDNVDSNITQTSVGVDGTGGMVGQIAGGPKFQAQVNSTKTCVVTISPDNATDKTILWTTSDPTKVSIATATTQSGANQTLTLVSVFNGNVAITATAEANSAAKVTFNVSVYNFVTTLEYVGIGNGWDGSGSLSAGDIATSFPASRHDNDTEDESILYQTGSAAAPTVYFKYTEFDPANGDYPFIVLRAYGRDKTIAPDLAATTGVYKYKTAANLGLTEIGHEAYFIVEPASDWTVGSKTFTIEDASKTVTLAAYVAPASVSGGGDIQFK